MLACAIILMLPVDLRSSSCPRASSSSLLYSFFGTDISSGGVICPIIHEYLLQVYAIELSRGWA